MPILRDQNVWCHVFKILFQLTSMDAQQTLSFMLRFLAEQFGMSMIDPRVQFKTEFGRIICTLGMPTARGWP